MKKSNDFVSVPFDYRKRFMSVRFLFCILLLPMSFMMIGCAVNNTVGILADYDHPLVVETAGKIAEGATSDRDKAEKFFYYVRDDILFGFAEKNNFMKASDVIEAKTGYCNNKATLFLALCKNADIPARMHFGEAKLDFFKGIYPSYVMWASPSTASHGWIEVKIDGKWHPMDSYIIDPELFRSSLKKLELENRDMGYGIVCPAGKCGNAFDLSDETFVQMGAVIDDHGVWDDPSDYYASDQYIKIGPIDQFFYKFMYGSFNDNIETIRKGL